MCFDKGVKIPLVLKNFSDQNNIETEGRNSSLCKKPTDFNCNDLRPFFTFMPCSFTAPKIFCAGPKI